MSALCNPGLYQPSPAVASVIERYAQANRVSKADCLKTARSQQDYLAHMRAMQRELIQAHLPDMGLEDALRATRTLDLLARQDADALAGGAA